MRKGDWLQTVKGRQFWPTDPRPEDFDIEEIAHALSMQCRFTGHCAHFYSVAEHSVHVSNIVPSEFALAGLLHDASEAYLVDVPRPLKRLPEFAPYREIEQNIQAMIYGVFGLSRETPIEVKIADEEQLNSEAIELMKPLHKEWHLSDMGFGIAPKCWNYKEAEFNFLFRYYQIIATQKQRKDL